MTYVNVISCGLSYARRDVRRKLVLGFRVHSLGAPYTVNAEPYGTPFVTKIVASRRRVENSRRRVENSDAGWRTLDAGWRDSWGNFSTQVRVERFLSTQGREISFSRRRVERFLNAGAKKKL